MNYQILAPVAAMLIGGGGAHGQLAPRESQSRESAVVLSGEVTMNNGSPPPAAVLIRRMCNGRVASETWTDSEGRYKMRVDGAGGAEGAGDATQAAGQPSDLNKPFGNATVYTNPVTFALKGCELRAVLAGFREEAIMVNVRSTMDDARMPPMVLHPLSRADALTVSSTTEMAPKNARKAYERGVAAMKEQKWDAAGREFTSATKEYPKFAIAWDELGRARERQGDRAGAAQAWKEALNADPAYLRPYETLAALADQKQDWAESARYSSGWIHLDPEDFPAAYLLNAVANARMNRLDEAERAAREGLRIDKNRRIPRLSYVLGMILAEKHKYSESVEQFRDYLKLAPNARDADAVREQLIRLDRAAAEKQ